MPKVSIVIPIHKEMENGAFFLWRAVQSVMDQSFKDYELIIVQEGSMPVNSNAGIKKSRGQIVKVLYMDDYFTNSHSLQNIVDAFTRETEWLVTGCLHQSVGEAPHSPHFPEYTEDLQRGNNRIGSPSVLAFRNHGKRNVLFDEKLSWLLDADLYKRLHSKFGPPTILNDLNVVIGLGPHQTTHTLSEDRKRSEHIYLANKKYDE